MASAHQRTAQQQRLIEKGAMTIRSQIIILRTWLLAGFLLVGICVPGGSSVAQAIADSTLATTNHQPALKLGIYPYSYTARIVPIWKPLADYQQQQLQQPVVIVSAVDNTTFAQRAADGDYFLYAAAPHVAAWGYGATAVDNSSEALQLLTGEAESDPGFDLLISDIVMPNMDGQRLAELARQQHPHLKVLFVSGYKQASLIKLQPGYTELLTKPFSAKELLAKIRQMLDPVVDSA